MATIRIDGRSYRVEAGRNLLEVALSESIDLPYFCWHPELGSVGACRQCAVMQYTGDEDATGRLVMACMTPVSDAMRFSVEAAHAREFRATVIEWLMLNHPHDCPVCEEGGECHLQDMTVMTGHSMRLQRGTKRTWRNQYLGPFINHEMNRCITCYRCVRFYRDYAGGSDLDEFGSRDRVYFGRAEDGVLENEFSGNLVEVCPTGVFTDRPFARRYTRKWDLVSAPSVCPGCSLGCATLVGQREDELRRVHNRYHPEVNRYFLCDRGRFGQTWVNEAERIREVGRRREDGSFDPVDAGVALEAVAAGLGGERVLGIGSPRASLESNFMLSRLVGRERFCPGFAVDETAPLRRALDRLRRGPGRLPSLAEVEEADAVLVLGEDPIDSAPRLALSLRQAVHARARVVAADAGLEPWQDAGVRSHGRYSSHPLFLATLLPSRSAGIAEDCRTGSPGELARLGEAIAASIRADGESDDAFVAAAAKALLAAERPLVVSGTSLGDESVVAAAGAVIEALAARERDPGCVLLPREANSFGVGLLAADGTQGPDPEAALARLEADEVDLLIIVENDLTRRADPERVRAALARAGTVVVIDSVAHDTAAAADWLLPAAAVTESLGTLVSNEGRAQRFYPALRPAAPVAPAWRWLADLEAAAGRDRGCEHHDQVVDALVAAHPGLAGVREAAPRSRWRDVGGLGVARAPSRASGRTARTAHLDVHEPRTPVDPESPLTWSMEGLARPTTPSALTPWYWRPGWNSNQAVTRFQEEVAGPLRGGSIGRRLLPSDGRGGEPSAQTVAATGAPAPGELRAAPLWHIFGSDELSARSAALAERMPVPRLVLAPAAAESLELVAGAGVRLHSDAHACGVFRLEVDPAMAEGWLALSCGLPGTPGTVPRGRLTLEVVPDWTPPAPDGVIARG